jgi:hypothetical protein
MEDEYWVDEDIAQTSLSDGEKAGLQVYRNYTRAFRREARNRFIELLNSEELDLAPFIIMCDKIVSEDGRYLPMIICAYAEDVLKTAFKKTVPDGIPGGKDKLFGGYGPLSSFSKLIQIGYAFDVVSGDLMQELDKVRSARNKLAHSWDINDLEQFFTDGRLGDIFPLENQIFRRDEFKSVKKIENPLTLFRIRMLWVLGRLTYEAAASPQVRMSSLSRTEALFVGESPKWLTDISSIAMAATKKLIDRL